MTKKQQDAVVKEVKTLLPLVDAYTTRKGHKGFDFGYLHNATPPYWEFDFCDFNEQESEHFECSTIKEAIIKLKA